MNYSKELQHPLWQKRRLEIINRDNCTCQYCSDQTTQLQIHHKYYTTGSRPWEYPDEALVSACKHCHDCITTLQEMGWQPLVATKLRDDNLPDFVAILMAHKDDSGKCAISLFTNPNRSNKMEYVNTITEGTIKKMDELLTMAAKLM